MQGDGRYKLYLKHLFFRATVVDYISVCAAGSSRPGPHVDGINILQITTVVLGSKVEHEVERNAPAQVKIKSTGCMNLDGLDSFNFIVVSRNDRNFYSAWTLYRQSGNKFDHGSNQRCFFKRSASLWAMAG
jgi:hypothetical protein